LQLDKAAVCDTRSSFVLSRQFLINVIDRMRYLLLFVAVAFLASCGKDVEGLTPEEYISQNNLQATELENGVYIVVHDEGNDVNPNAENVIDVNFVGRLTNEVVFGEAEDFTVQLGTLIQGWQIGLKEIGEGGSCTLIVPHKMGYGDLANGTIPAKSTLIYDIVLNNVYSTRTIEEYIADNELNTVELEKGVHIAVNEQGSEVRPTLENKVTVNYIGKLTNELVFDQGQNVQFELAKLIEGWQIGLQEIGEGGSCTLVVPSEVAYGSAGAGSIPPNAPIVFDIDLISVD